MNLLYTIASLILLLSISDVLADDWPMYRKDSGRTAVCESELPSDLVLTWTRKFPPLEPAFRSPRLHFDAGYEPVSAGGVLLMASSRTDSVTAFDAETGEQIWIFRTNGPVRLAPAIWKDRVCFGSDDGHLYCTELRTGKLCWKQRAAPSDRRLLGNGRLISVWPVRGGPVVADGRVYFAAGVWPFEGVFVYAMEIETGEVVWRNDRMGYLFGRQPHNTQAIGGLAPQGYLMIDGDELIVPCSTAFPARLKRSDGTLIEFELPGPGRLPGGWFSQLDTDTARALRRGKITFDDLVNRQEHEDKEHKAPGGVSGLSRQIRTGATQWNFDDGFQGVTGDVHSMIVAEDRMFVVMRDGKLSCFAPKSSTQADVKHWNTNTHEIVCAAASVQRAQSLVSLAGNDRGIAMVLGIHNGDLVRALVKHSNYHIVAFDDDQDRVKTLRTSLLDSGVDSARAAVIHCDLSALELPPYLATLLTTERGDQGSLPHLQALRPFGGIAAMGASVATGTIESKRIEAEEPGTFTVESNQGEPFVRRVGPLPGSKEYSGNWANSEDSMVRFPLGVLWFDDSLAHFKRSPQPQFTDGVMISRPKDWHAARVIGNYKIDYPLLPVVLSDIYTGRVLAETENASLRATLPKSDPSKHEPSQYRPPRQNNAWKPNQPVVGQRTNPLTGKQEPRAFPKTYGCDGGVDYGLLYTLRSGTPAYYDKSIESGTVFLSGPRSGCTNSIIPSGGVLNVPYFYEGCTCSYPLPSALSLVQMPQRFEQWSSWGEMEILPGSIERIGLNFGAPGDRMTRGGTLWLDYPSVGGPSPEIDVRQTGEDVKYRYQHSMWMNQEDAKPWVTASMAEGLESVEIHDLKPGEYSVNLYFAEPDDLQVGDRVQNVQLQDEQVLQRFDILAVSGHPMSGVVVPLTGVTVDGTLELKLNAVTGRTLISGVDLQIQD